MRAHSVARLSPGSLRCSAATGGLRNSGFALRQSSPFFPLRLALLDDAKGQLTTDRIATVWRMKYRSVCFSSPSCSAEQRRRAGGSRRGLSEGRSPEFRSRPACRVAQGSRRSRPRNAGVAFFLVTFSWRRKKKLPARQARNKASQSNPFSEAITAACTRELTSSLRRMCCT